MLLDATGGILGWSSQRWLQKSFRVAGHDALAVALPRSALLP